MKLLALRPWLLLIRALHVSLEPNQEHQSILGWRTQMMRVASFDRPKLHSPHSGHRRMAHRANVWGFGFKPLSLAQLQSAKSWRQSWLGFWQTCQYNP